MGTHGKLAITFADGSHWCVERPMDGNRVIDALWDWMDAELGSFDDLQEPHSAVELAELADAYGGGSKQMRHEDQEHEALYIVWVDFSARLILIDPETLGNLYRDPELRRLEAYGWTIEPGDDCDYGEAHWPDWLIDENQ